LNVKRFGCGCNAKGSEKKKRSCDPREGKRVSEVL
jgi:hypothetical protein